MKLENLPMKLACPLLGTCSPSSVVSFLASEKSVSLTSIPSRLETTTEAGCKLR